MASIVFYSEYLIPQGVGLNKEHSRITCNDHETTDSRTNHDDDTDSLLDYRSAIADSVSRNSPIHTPSLVSFDSDTITFTSESSETNSQWDHNTVEDEDKSCATFEGNANLYEEQLNADLLPKTFLQLKGISVANYNMGCNFNISAALHIMVHYELSIFAIQEHTPWSRELTDAEHTNIERICDKYGYFVTISKVQILIIAKEIRACHRHTTVYEQGRLILSRFEIS